MGQAQMTLLSFTHFKKRSKRSNDGVNELHRVPFTPFAPYGVNGVNLRVKVFIKVSTLIKRVRKADWKDNNFCKANVWAHEMDTTRSLAAVGYTFRARILIQI